MSEAVFDLDRLACETARTNDSSHDFHLRSMSSTPERRKKTITITFRLDESVIVTLRGESEHSHTSLNTLANQILQRYIEWDIYEHKVGFISLSRPVAAALFRNMSKQEIIEMATGLGRTATSDAVLFMKKKMDLDSFLAWFETCMRHSSIEISHKVNGDINTYILKHDLGENYSLFEKTLLELIFRDVLGKHLVDCSFSDTILSFSFSA